MDLRELTKNIAKLCLQWNTNEVHWQKGPVQSVQIPTVWFWEGGHILLDILQ